MARNVRRSVVVVSALLGLAACSEQSLLQNAPQKPTFDQPSLATVNVNGMSFDRVIVDPNGPTDPYMKNIARLDGDGLPDLIVSGAYGPAVWYQAPNWTKRTISNSAQSQSGSATGDIDLDGDVDIVIGKTWYENVNGGNSFTARNLPGGSAATHDVVLADVNSDGKPDIIMRGESATVVTIYLQTNPTTWVPFDVQPGVGLNGLDVADVNGDGRADIVVGGVWMENPGGNVASSTWTKHVYASWNEYASVKVIDLDKDGRMDIVLSVSEQVGKLSWFKGPADPENGTWTEKVIDTGLAKVHCFAVEDVNADGNLDVIASEFEGAGRLIVYLSTGATWQPSELGRDSLHNMRAGDIDADGDIDFFGTYCFGDRPVILYRNTGSGVPASAPPTVQTGASASPSTVTGSSSALSVLGADDGGEGSLRYTWTTSGSPPAGVSFSPNGSNAAKNSTATFARAGTYQLVATIADAQGQVVTSGVTVTVSQTLTGILVTPSTASVAAGATQTFTAATSDQFGQPMGSNPTFTWTVSGGGSINASGVFTAGGSAGGPFVVTAAGSGKTGTASVSVTAGGGGGGGTANFGETNVLTTPDGGNGGLLVAMQAALAQAGTVQSLSFYVASPSGKLRLGIYDATGPNGGPGAKRAETAEITPVTGWNTAAVTTPVALPAGSYWLAYLTNTDALGFRMATNGAGRWYSVSYGVMPATYSTSPSAGAYHWSLYATIGTSGPPPASNQAPTIATAAGANPGAVNASTSVLSVLGADDAGESALKYTWATTGSPPAAVSFSPNGTNAAKSSTATFTRAGTYQLTVAVADAQGLTATSNVTVTVNQTLTSVVVTPSSATVAPSATQAFAAAARDQFSQAMSSTPTFTWTVSGGGTISSAGLFTAGGATGGPFTVTASTGGKSGTASVTVAGGGGGGGSPVNIGETNILSLDDGGNGGLLVAMQANLPSARTIQSLSFYVTTASGKLRLGIYDATGPNGGPGVKRAETAEFTPVAGWNTKVVVTPVSLPAGNYWLAYFSNTNSLRFRMMTNGSGKWYSTTYGTMPNTYSTNPSAGAYHWSFYATMQ